MRVLPSTAFKVRFWAQATIIDTAATDPHKGQTGIAAASFEIWVCKPGGSSPFLQQTLTTDYTIAELGYGWYEMTMVTTSNFVDATTGPGNIHIRYNPGIVPEGHNDDVPIWEHRYEVGYDPGDVRQWGGTAPNALVSGRVDSSVGAMAASVLTASAIASNAITSAKIATDAIGAAQIAADAIGSSELAATAVTEIQSGLATAANLALVQVDTDDIQSRLPASLVGGRMDSSVGAMAADVITAAATAADFGTEVATAVWDFVTEGTTKAVEAFRGITAFAMGRAAFSGTNRKYRNLANTKDVIDATVDATGRTAVTRDLT